MIRFGQSSRNLTELIPTGRDFEYPDANTKEVLHEIDPFHIKRVVTDIEFYLDAFHDYCTAGKR